MRRRAFMASFGGAAAIGRVGRCAQETHTSNFISHADRRPLQPNRSPARCRLFLSRRACSELGFDRRLQCARLSYRLSAGPDPTSARLKDFAVELNSRRIVIRWPAPSPRRCARERKRPRPFPFVFVGGSDPGRAWAFVRQPVEARRQCHRLQPSLNSQLIGIEAAAAPQGSLRPPARSGSPGLDSSISTSNASVPALVPDVQRSGERADLQDRTGPELAVSPTAALEAILTRLARAGECALIVPGELGGRTAPGVRRTIIEFAARRPRLPALCPAGSRSRRRAGCNLLRHRAGRVSLPARRRLMSIASSRARSLRTFPCRRRTSFTSSSTSRPPRRLGLNFRRPLLGTADEAIE